MYIYIYVYNYIILYGAGAVLHPPHDVLRPVLAGEHRVGGLLGKGNNNNNNNNNSKHINKIQMK